METIGCSATASTDSGSGTSDSGCSLGWMATSDSPHSSRLRTEAEDGGGDIGRRYTSTAPEVRASSSSSVDRSTSTTRTSGLVRASPCSRAGTKAALALGYEPSVTTPRAPLRHGAIAASADSSARSISWAWSARTTAGLGQLHGALAAVEEGQADLALQRGDVHADAGLRPLGGLGRGDEAPRFDDREEGDEPFQPDIRVQHLALTPHRSSASSRPNQPDPARSAQRHQ